ncbi:MAG TPA: site-specific integrase [Clostridiaceae bacterium]|nr:site-specific integrase [Clostridiaceae bacterium]
MINVRKRGNFYQYQFEVAPVDGKRKQVTKSGFKTKAEAKKAGIKAYNEYEQTGHSFQPSTISFSDYLDYWLKEHCHINLKYNTIQADENIIKNHIKPRVGFYRLSQITTSTLQEFINNTYVEYTFSKNFMKNILKVLRTSLAYATDVVSFIKENPALKVKSPKYDIPDKDPAHIFTKEEINMILNRFKKNHAFYYATLTAYYTGLRVSEVYGLTWDDIDFENKKISVNKNIVEKNHKGSTHGRHLSGNATTVWYFGTYKTKSSYRTIDIGDTLLNALKEYKKEQEENKIEYGDSYMKHYAKEVTNQYTKKLKQKLIY